MMIPGATDGTGEHGMLVVFVHGWSVTDTETYGGLPEALAARAADFGLEIDIAHVWLGRYISFEDDVRMPDVVRAFDAALREQIPDNADRSRRFSCVTHSTGGPVVREWVERYFGAAGLGGLPLDHLVMLAPANHGSALATLGKERVGRIKAWFGGIQPGEGILDWLSLGSEDQWRLTERHLDYRPAENSFFPFTLVGQTIDHKFYDFLNTYLTEVGSDGVVRVAGANLNYSMVKLREDPEHSEEVQHGQERFTVQFLTPEGGLLRPVPTPLGVIPEASHSGEDIGIMRSVAPDNIGEKPVVDEILKCLTVQDADAYGQRTDELEALTVETQASDPHGRTHRYNMLVFRVRDDQGNPVDNFDMFLLAGPQYGPDALPRGFFVDRQRNTKRPNCLVYYVDNDVLSTAPEKRFGIRIIARPQEPFRKDEETRRHTYYRPVDFRIDGGTLAALLRPNETVYVDVELRRRIDKEIFRLDPGTAPRQSFKDRPLSGEIP